MTEPTPSQLEAFLDEALPPEEMAEIEELLREDRNLLRQLGQIHARRDSGVHSLGEIWRRNRLSCASRDQLGSYLLGTLDDEEIQYIDFHIGEIGCRLCAANLEDLRTRQAESDEVSQQRRRRYFESSAGYLSRE